MSSDTQTDTAQHDDTKAHVAVFEGLVAALLDPVDRARKAIPVHSAYGEGAPRSDAFNAPTGNGGDRQRGRRGGGR